MSSPPKSILRLLRNPEGVKALEQLGSLQAQKRMIINYKIDKNNKK